MICVILHALVQVGLSLAALELSWLGLKKINLKRAALLRESCFIRR
jgi:hypothetical protein